MLLSIWMMWGWVMLGVAEQFGFYLGDNIYCLEVEQEGLGGYQFLEHRVDDTFVFAVTSPYPSRFHELDRDLSVLNISQHPLGYRLSKAFTTSRGTILFIGYQDGMIWRYSSVNMGWANTGWRFNWLGSWSIDEHNGVIMAAEYTADTAEYARVIRSFDDGMSWNVVFMKNARASSSPEIRHFHTLMCDPYTGNWYLSSGDGWRECKVWLSKDDGDTWVDVTDYDLDPSLPPNVRTLCLHRLTAFWFTPEYICWATDDRINVTGARLVISPRSEPLDIRVVGRVSYNEVRSVIEFPGKGWLLITENKSGYVGIELVFISKDFEIIPLGILYGITDNFTASVASRRAYWDEKKECWVAYSLARLVEPPIVRYKLFRNFRVNAQVNSEHGGYVEVEPEKICGYKKGDRLTLRAVEYPGYVFTGWSGDYVSASKILKIEVDRDISVMAHFYPEGAEPEYKVNVMSPSLLLELSIIMVCVSVFYLCYSGCRN
ncbi:MAG: hypothetical protein N3G21_02225 [Candidatus Hydrogenedentes bacterium]|nr:hypothetical protein [Candidatus Hydrogenedentota bacterium]